jgi:hypothetical protein
MDFLIFNYNPMIYQNFTTVFLLKTPRDNFLQNGLSTYVLFPDNKRA